MIGYQYFVQSMDSSFSDSPLVSVALVDFQGVSIEAAVLVDFNRDVGLDVRADQVVCSDMQWTRVSLDNGQQMGRIQVVTVLELLFDCSVD